MKKPDPQPEANQLDTIKEMLPAANPVLFSRPNVVATGIGYKTVNGEKTERLCIICSVETKVSAALLDQDELIPPDILGIPTDVLPVGLIRAHQSPTDRFRPAPGGVSTGHFHITAGTLGCLVKKEKKTMILSNNHVFANTNQAVVGDMILQPGPHDGGKVREDAIARLTAFIPILFENEQSSSRVTNAFAGIFNFFARLTGSSSRLYARYNIQPENLVDCAIAEPIKNAYVKNEILGAGSISGVAEGVIDMKVKKSGRTTGLTHGIIEQVDVTVRVNFGAGKTALFRDQLLAGAMSQGGDSGSAVLNEKNELVGLLFAGSSNTTIFNRIQNVMELLDIEI
jgi:hypothetical protein